MKKSILFACLFLLGGLSFTFAGTGAPVPVSSSQTEQAGQLSKQEMRQQQRLVKKVNWLDRLITQKVEKSGEKAEKSGRQIFDSLDHYLRLALIFFIAAVILSVLASLMSGIAVFAEITAILAGASAVASVIFFILWLAENV